MIIKPHVKPEFMTISPTWSQRYWQLPAGWTDARLARWEPPDNKLRHIRVNTELGTRQHCRVYATRFSGRNFCLGSKFGVATLFRHGGFNISICRHRGFNSRICRHGGFNILICRHGCLDIFLTPMLIYDVAKLTNCPCPAPFSNYNQREQSESPTWIIIFSPFPKRT